MQLVLNHQLHIYVLIFEDGIVDDNGWLVADDFGRLSNCKGCVLALSDCLKGELKSGAYFMCQRDTMAKNILQTLKLSKFEECKLCAGVRKI